jgi:hypothetical protein
MLAWAHAFMIMGNGGARGGCSKAGRRALRHMMVEAAQSASRHNGHGRAELARLRRRLGYGKALVAIARTLLVAVWHVLTKHTAHRHAEPYQVARLLMVLSAGTRAPTGWAIGAAVGPDAARSARAGRGRDHGGERATSRAAPAPVVVRAGELNGVAVRCNRGASTAPRLVAGVSKTWLLAGALPRRSLGGGARRGRGVVERRMRRPRRAPIIVPHRRASTSRCART